MGYTHGESWDEEKIKSKILEMVSKTGAKTFPTHSEIIEFYGNAKLTNAIKKHGGTKYWAEKLGIESKSCESKFGNKYEEQCAKDVFYKLDLESEICQVRYPYDLLVENCVKIDVKAANLYCPKNNSGFFTFNLEKKMQTCDVFVAYCILDEEVKKVYVIPAIELSGRTQLSIGLNASVKYDRFLDRWDIISKYAEFMKGCV